MSLSKAQRDLLIRAWREHPVSPPLGVGVIASGVLAVIALISGSSVIGLVALGPLFLGLLYHGFVAQTSSQLAPMQELTNDLKRVNTALKQQVGDLTRLRDVMLALGATFDRSAVLDELTRAITTLLNFDRSLVLLYDAEQNTLNFAAFSHAAPDTDAQFLLEQLQFALDDDRDDPLFKQCLAGDPVLVDDATTLLQTRFNLVITTLNLKRFFALPLTVGDQKFKGVIIADNSVTDRAIAPEQQSLLATLGAYIAVTLENARLYQHTDDRLNSRVQELEILSRINRELNFTLSVERVLNLTLDWALRFTGADAATVALVEDDKQQMHFVSGYGYGSEQWEKLKQGPWPQARGITGRVATTNEAEIVGDVTQDAAYVEIAPGTKSQLSVPVSRENRVIAVISLESQRANAFTPENMAFVKRLASRAAAAIDNANLYAEAERERRKLEIILSNITNAVIVVDHEKNLVLVNQAALHLLHLPTKEEYVGRPFSQVFRHKYTDLNELFERAMSINRSMAAEIATEEEKTLHVSVVPAPEIGWSIVAHDITPFKETEQLKNELVATASHDLKNPLGSILGYVDLIAMTNPLNEPGQEYLSRVHNAVNHMRDLIDDLLDLARIESGITLRYSLVNLDALVREVSDRFEMQVREKAMKLAVDISGDLPLVPADASRLTQLVANLVSNAIKYTPPEGYVTVMVERLGGAVQVSIKDDGLGISPEDQAQIFGRFYRVRTAETDAIEGTGLGLAIVKSLVELHSGQLGVESKLGEGSTFYFTLPVEAPPDVQWIDGEERQTT
ncbi:MAG: GAF domain-containing protein [Anaerolineae bacterium]|nr:GAF domain-containing protein [Anaerolineae bacterium]